MTKKKSPFFFLFLSTWVICIDALRAQYFDQDTLNYDLKQNFLLVDAKLDSLSAQANVDLNHGQFQHALCKHLEVLNGRAKLHGEASIQVTWSQHNLANCLIKLGHYNKANYWLKKSLFNASKHQDNIQIAKIQNSIGHLYHKQGLLNKAKGHFLVALHIREKNLGTKHPDLMIVLVNLVAVALDQRDFKSAAYFINWLKKLHHNSTALLFAQRLQANSLHRRGLYKQSINLYKHTLEQWEIRAKMDMEEWGICLIELSTAFQESGEIDLALQLYHKALGKLNQIQGWGYLRLVIHNNLAALFQQIGNTTQAIVHYREGGKLALSSNKDQQNSIFINLVSLFIKTQQLDSARLYSARIQKNNPNLEASISCLLLEGQLCEQQGSTGGSFYQQAYNIAKINRQQLPELFAITIIHLARSVQKKGELALANQLLANAWTALGQGHKLKTFLRPNETLQVLASQANLALVKAKASPSPQTWHESWVIHQKAIGFFQHHQHQLYGKLSVLLLRDAFKSVFEGMIETCFAKGQYDPVFFEQAFIYADLSKVLLLRRSLLESKAKFVAGVSAFDQEQEISLQNSILAINEKIWGMQDMSTRTMLVNKLALLEEKHYKLVKKMERTYPRYAALKYDTEMVKIKILQNRLRHDQSMVAFFGIDEFIFIFVLNKSSLHVRKVPIKPKFYEQIQAWYVSISQVSTQTKDLQLMCLLGHTIYKELLSPIATRLHSRVIIVPDNQLSFIPFESLLYQSVDPSLPIGAYPFLLKKHAFSYLSSAGFLVEHRREKSRFRRLLGVAPTFEEHKQGLSNLPLSEAEISNAFKHLCQNKKLLKNLDATENNFRQFAPSAGIIHVSTHGVLNTENPDFSFLAFADYDPNTYSKGRLNVAEVYSLKLNVHLLFLSACNTEIGNMQIGEGMWSLSRAFKQSGVHCLISSLWQIPDRPSLKIVELFYKNLKDGMSKDLALQQAKKLYLENAKVDLAHPACWGAFYLSGDLSPIQFSFYFCSFWATTALVISVMFIFWYLKKRYRTLFS